MKKVLLATVAASAMATSAFADVPSAVTTAVADINAALYNFGGDDATNAIGENLEDLLGYIDNHGAVSTVTVSNTGNAVYYSVNSDGVAALGNLPEVSVTLHDHSMEIGSEITDLQQAINTQFYGGSDKTEASWSITHDGTEYAMQGVIAGFVKDELDGFVATLNVLDAQIDGAGVWTQSDLSALDSNINSIEMEAGTLAANSKQLADATGAFGSFAASDDYRLRASTDAGVNFTLTNANGIVVDGANSVISVELRGAIDLANQTYIDAADVKAEAPAAE